VASPDVIVVTVEEGEAVAGIVRQYGVDELFSIRYGSGKGIGKGEGSKKDFFHAVLNQLKNSFISTSAEAIIIAGPDFVKNDFFFPLKRKGRKGGVWKSPGEKCFAVRCDRNSAD
jgi:protein pelota